MSLVGLEVVPIGWSSSSSGPWGAAGMC